MTPDTTVAVEPPYPRYPDGLRLNAVLAKPSRLHPAFTLAAPKRSLRRHTACPCRAGAAERRRSGAGESIPDSHASAGAVGAKAGAVRPISSRPARTETLGGSACSRLLTRVSGDPVVGIRTAGVASAPSVMGRIPAPIRSAGPKCAPLLQARYSRSKRPRDVIGVWRATSGRYSSRKTRATSSCREATPSFS